VEKMKKPLFQFPEPRAAVREGEAFLQFTSKGEVIGEINFSRIMKQCWENIKKPREEGLEVAR